MVLNQNSGIPSFTMGRVGDDLARGFSESTADVYRFTTGVDGDFGGTATWGVYYQFGLTDRLQTGGRTIASRATRRRPRAIRRTDALRARGGCDRRQRDRHHAGHGADRLPRNAELRPGAARAAAGCVPLNLFGPNNFSQAAKDYVYGTLREAIDIKQHVIAGNVQGKPLELWAGPLSLAGGLEFRRDEIDVVHDDLSNVFAYFQNFGADYNASSKVVEGFVEAELPLLKNKPAAQTLDLNVAARQTRYDLDGFGSYLRTSTSNEIDATTWKASLNWQPLDWLRLRGTRSRDIRAPNFADLYLASAGSFAPITNRFTGATQFPIGVNGGSPDLEAEKADTTTIGFVFSPQWGWTERLRLTVDAYDIKVKGYIGAPGTQFIVDRCFAGNAQACGLITFGPGQSLQQVRNISLNLDELRTRGEDIELSYDQSFAGGQLGFRLLAAHVEEITTETFGVAVDRAGQTGGLGSTALPKWLFRANASFSRDPWSVTVQARYIDSGVLDAQRFDPSDSGYSSTLFNSTNDNHVAGATYFNLFGNIDLTQSGPNVQLFAAITNLFDKEPPFAPGTPVSDQPHVLRSDWPQLSRWRACAFLTQR